MSTSNPSTPLRRLIKLNENQLDKLLKNREATVDEYDNVMNNIDKKIADKNELLKQLKKK